MLLPLFRRHADYRYRFLRVRLAVPATPDADFQFDVTF